MSELIGGILLGVILTEKKDAPERNGEIEMLKERIAVLEKVFGPSNRAC